jgi:hypothetical protein
MKYQIGDEIIVLLSNEEGKVVDIMNEKMVMIEVRGGSFLPTWIKLIFLISIDSQRKNCRTSKSTQAIC